jgi:hypothetical protein
MTGTWKLERVVPAFRFVLCLKTSIQNCSVILSKRIDSFYLFVQKRLSPLEGENAMRVA